MGLRSLLAHQTLYSVTEAHIIAWATADGANNTIRNRLSLARTFFTWAQQTARRADNPAADLARLNKQFPRTYGKTQAKYPARFLSADEARTLIATCDDTDKGTRDALILAFGLAGMRCAEIRNLTWRAIDQSAHITWTGKGNRIRTASVSVTMAARLTHWRHRWTTAAGHPHPDHPVICAQRQGGPPQRQAPVVWGRPITESSAIRLIVTARALQAGLGHVTPHDLRRSAASILHHATTDDGAHLFDLLDIQRVLGHTDPATTMRSYLEPLDRAATNDRAARTLDF